MEIVLRSKDNRTLIPPTPNRVPSLCPGGSLRDHRGESHSLKSARASSRPGNNGEALHIFKIWGDCKMHTRKFLAIQNLNRPTIRWVIGIFVEWSIFTEPTLCSGQGQVYRDSFAPNIDSIAFGELSRKLRVCCCCCAANWKTWTEEHDWLVDKELLLEGDCWLVIETASVESFLSKSPWLDLQQRHLSFVFWIVLSILHVAP